jgi:hypothetical protein
MPEQEIRMPEMAGETDPNDPLALIVRALRENADATDILTADSQAARQAMAEAERKMALRADTASAEMRSLTLAVQQLTDGRAAVRRLKAARVVWGCGGLILGAVLTSVVLTELPLWWRQIFG